MIVMAIEFTVILNACSALNLAPVVIYFALLCYVSLGFSVNLFHLCSTFSGVGTY